MSVEKLDVGVDGERMDRADRMDTAAVDPGPDAVTGDRAESGGQRLLRIVEASSVRAMRREAVDAETLRKAALIVEEVRLGGEAALRRIAERLGDLPVGGKLVWSRAELEAELEELPGDQRALLERTADRIRRFARAQRDSLRTLEVEIPGGRIGHRVEPMERAGCYAPGGRFPLPSSVLMTVIPARIAGVQEVRVASPKPTRITLAAAAVAGADELLAVGGAQAIAALALGAGVIPPADIVVGPGNSWVTAAKRLVMGEVAIDMLAGPSELVILADAQADPAWIAADLLAQAEHDPEALPVLIALDSGLIGRVEEALRVQLEDLPTAPIAEAALRNGFAVVAQEIEEAIELCDRLAPEHLELLIRDPGAVASSLRHYGALFVGAGAAEVLGDYGIGPNHVLPTGGTSRSAGGLSALSFLRVRTFLELDDPRAAAAVVDDAAALARLEGLEGHARSALRRR